MIGDFTNQRNFDNSLIIRNLFLSHPLRKVIFLEFWDQLQNKPATTKQDCQRELLHYIGKYCNLSNAFILAATQDIMRSVADCMEASPAEFAENKKIVLDIFQHCPVFPEGSSSEVNKQLETYIEERIQKNRGLVNMVRDAYSTTRGFPWLVKNVTGYSKPLIAKFDVSLENGFYRRALDYVESCKNVLGLTTSQWPPAEAAATDYHFKLGLHQITDVLEGKDIAKREVSAEDVGLVIDQRRINALLWGTNGFKIHQAVKEWLNDPKLNRMVTSEEERESVLKQFVVDSMDQIALNEQQAFAAYTGRDRVYATQASYRGWFEFSDGSTLASLADVTDEKAAQTAEQITAQVVQASLETHKAHQERIVNEARKREVAKARKRPRSPTGGEPAQKMMKATTLLLSPRAGATRAITEEMGALEIADPNPVKIDTQLVKIETNYAAIGLVGLGSLLYYFN